MVRSPRDVIEDALAGLGVTVSVSARNGDLPEGDHGEEEESCGNEQGPEVGQDG